MASVLTEQHNNISRHDSMQRAIAWKDATKKQAADNLRGELDALLRTVKEDDSKQLWEKQFHGYQSLFNKYLVEKPFIDWSKIQPLPAGSIQDYGSLPEPSPDVARQLLKRLVVVKLNGGLGTSMGCKGPKSTIVVREDLTFLDMTMQQIEHLNTTYGQDVPLVLMNSFNTDDDTKKVLQKYRNVQVKVVSFNQSQYPRINKETLLPIVRNVENSHIDDWYPPGHGDFYESFYNSGQLNYFLQSGRDVAFISNIDNLGATVDLRILHNMLSNGESQNDFVMEVTDKTRADVKGGTLVGYQDRLRLLEIAQVPKENVDDFKSVSKFKIFNTNNLWCNLRAVSDHVSKGRMDMEVIVNPKVTDNGIPVIQLETAIGAAIKNFKGAIGVNVPRARFLPVKKTQDLLLVMSNLYDLDNGHLTLSHLRSFSSTPLVKLGTSYDKVHHFISRFAGVPDLLELDHLTVSGDVTFGRNVSLKGTVIIVASHGDRIDIPAGALLENKIVSGNLRILDH